MREYGKNPNHHRVRFYDFNGERRTIVGWMQRFGLTYTCVQSRLKLGIPLDQPKSRRGRPSCSARATPEKHEPRIRHHEMECHCSCGGPWPCSANAKPGVT